MSEAARQADRISGPTWIIAKTQTAARGRRGRSWEVPEGNLNATLIYHPGCTPQIAAQRSFMAALALFEALSLHVDRTKLSLKWPNDVLLNGGKVAGILLETRGQGPFIDWLAVGVGVNLARTPAGVRDAAFPPVSLAGEGGGDVDPTRFLAEVAGAFATQEKKLDALGFDRIRREWLRHAARLGEVITARTGREELTGLFQTIDADGNLVLETEDGPTAVPAADIYFQGVTHASGH